MDATSFSSDDFHRLFANVSADEMPFNYHEPMTVYRCLLITAYCLLFVIGVAGNLWVAGVIGVVMRQSSVNPTAYAETPRSVQIYILSLCTCDLLVLTLLIFLISDLIYGQWVFPSSTFLCRLYLSGEFLNKFAGPILLTGLAGYCYACICLNSPKELEEAYGSCSTPRLVARRVFKWCGGESGKAALVFVAFCLGSVFVLVAPIYMYSDVQYLVIHNASIVYTIIPKCALQPPSDATTAFTVYGFIFGFLAPSTSFTFFYVSILLHVRRHNRKWRASVERSLYFWRVAKVTGGLVIFYLGCWTPYWITNVVVKNFTPSSDGEADDTSTFLVVLSYFIHMLPYINCTGYPILYTVLNRNIKAAYGRAKALRQHRRNQTSTPSRTDEGRWGGFSMCCELPHRNAHLGSSQPLTCNNDLLTPPPVRGLSIEFSKDCTTYTAF